MSITEAKAIFVPSPEGARDLPGGRLLRATGREGAGVGVWVDEGETQDESHDLWCGSHAGGTWEAIRFSNWVCFFFMVKYI